MGNPDQLTHQNIFLQDGYLVVGSRVLENNEVSFRGGIRSISYSESGACDSPERTVGFCKLYGYFEIRIRWARNSLSNGYALPN